jgi:hypothetical protein
MRKESSGASKSMKATSHHKEGILLQGVGRETVNRKQYSLQQLQLLVNKILDDNIGPIGFLA